MWNGRHPCKIYITILPCTKVDSHLRSTPQSLCLLLLHESPLKNNQWNRKLTENYYVIINKQEHWTLNMKHAHRRNNKTKKKKKSGIKAHRGRLNSNGSLSWVNRHVISSAAYRETRRTQELHMNMNHTTNKHTNSHTHTLTHVDTAHWFKYTHPRHIKRCCSACRRVRYMFYVYIVYILYTTTRFCMENSLKTVVNV